MAKKTVLRQTNNLIAILLVSTGIASIQCSSDNNTKPAAVVIGSNGGTGSGDVGGTGNLGGETGVGGDSTSSQGGTGETDGGGETGGASNGGLDGGGGASTGGASTCDPTPGPNGCYPCSATTNEQFLNHCTNSQCSAFNNAARLPLYNGGSLPQLP